MHTSSPSRLKNLLLSALVASSTLPAAIGVEPTAIPSAPITEQIPQPTNTARSSVQNAEDQFKLGRAYFRGEGVPQSYEKAGYWYQKSADQGNTKAMHNLGIMFIEGIGTPKNEATGYFWISKAADLGDQGSQELKGILLAQGKGVSKDTTQGIALLEKAAKLGDRAALARLGEDYLLGGDGIVKDPKKAVPYITEAAKAGSPWACGALGQLYLRGQAGLPCDKSLAEPWLKKGAELDDAESQTHYASILLSKSTLFAYPWLKLALGRTTDPLCNNLMTECRLGMKPEQLAEGDAEYERLKKQYGFVR